MGSARHRSWSHTRGKLAASCPRALYFQYYPWGDEKQNIARFLRRAVSVESLAGTIVHRHIALGLRQLLRRRSYPKGFSSAAAAEYEAALKLSKFLAKAVREGRRPSDEGQVLFHHLYGRDDEIGESKGLVSIQSSLDRFYNSSALEFLKGTNFDRWKRILTNTDDTPCFTATAELGFQSAVGLRIYAAYDLALEVDDDLIVIDWKMGNRSAASEARTQRQLAVYALWGMSNGHSLDRIKVAPHWLGDDPPLEPRSVLPELIRSVVEQIDVDDHWERNATRPIADEHGEIVRYDAGRGDFEARPEAALCGWCPYWSICLDGLKAVDHACDLGSPMGLRCISTA